MAANCIFCKIIKGSSPSEHCGTTCQRINPLSYGHTLIIPKHHGAKLTDIPEEHLTELLPVASRIAKASGAADYNILQNNGRLAHQEVDHVHVHMIPKPNEKEGLGVQWPQQNVEKERLQKLVEEIKSKM
ncbi:Adenosine 5'-monophosphoramidase [Friedmanniomyces endolithicus]|uniref:Adenosine 5'-monophosphoramidase n=1 Tax=Friedmanniomyces endolithicus TaxID=329885 RepID=A0AAN6K4Z6_9PEZI|nr:Adenosine 5'-monophosphoramidase [Friedmanniomyces endolithicus]